MALEFTIRKRAMEMRVNHQKESDGVRIHQERKSNRARVDHEKKSDGVRVHHEKE